MLDVAKRLAKRLARALLGEYAAYYIYVSPDKPEGARHRDGALQP